MSAREAAKRSGDDIAIHDGFSLPMMSTIGTEPRQSVLHGVSAAILPLDDVPACAMP